VHYVGFRTLATTTATKCFGAGNRDAHGGDYGQGIMAHDLKPEKLQALTVCEIRTTRCISC
jgi:hypothetical protein